MSTLCLKNTSHIQNVVHINGRPQYDLSRIKTIEKLGTNHWDVTTTSGAKAFIGGGKALGGSCRDWFLTFEGSTKPIRCTSLRDALHCLVNA